MTVETGLDVCVNKMAGTINKTMKNKILLIHAAWLFENGYHDEYIDCLKQAASYSQSNDWRQTKKLKRTGVQIMPRAIPCTSSCDPRYGRGSLGAFARLGVRARKLGGFYD
jgi:hypothetical protein